MLVVLLREESSSSFFRSSSFSPGMMKFARGAKHFQAQQFEKYKENCQKQFEFEHQ